MSYFDETNKEYVIDDIKPRRPLVNYLWSEKVVYKVDHFGAGKSLACVDTVRRPITDGQKHVFIKRGEEIYSANRNFAELPFDSHRTVVGLGYQRIVSAYKGLEVETTFLVPEDGYLELSNIKLVNQSDRELEFDMFFYAKPYVNTTGHTSYSRGDFCGELNGILCTHNSYKPQHGYNTLLVRADKKIESCSLSDPHFMGVYGSICSPEALKKPSLDNLGVTFEDDYCAALHFKFALKPRGSESVNIAIALGKDKEEVLDYTDRYCSQAAYEKNLLYQQRLHKKHEDIFKVESGDKVFDSSVNLWLKRQISLGKTWGRVYGKGFRDVMQDITGFVSFDPALAKSRILYALKYQFADGNTIRMFEPDFLAPYTDGAAWIPAAVLSYINETGDLGILSEKAGFYNSEEIDSVLGHMERGIEYLTSHLGVRGLCLWGGGDWNDSLNNCGTLGKGESVWLSIATVKAVAEYAETAKLVNKDCKEFEKRAESLKKSIYKYGFEGDRFIYGYNDYGEKVGSCESEEAKLYLNPQTWAVISGIADEKTAKIISETVESNLKSAFGYKQCVPPYSKGSDKLGRASYFTAGLVENGSVYLHGVMFKIVSDCVMGEGNRAYATYLMTRYDNPDNPDNGMEPYAVSNMFIGDDCPYSDLAGYAPMSWVTGSAGWLYRGLTEYLLGIKARGGGLNISPCLPDGWDNIKVTRLFRGARYEIVLERGEAALYIDGVKTDGSFVPFDGKNHKIICRVR